MYDEFVERRTPTRSPILRNAVLYTPAAVVSVVLFMLALASLLSGNSGAILPTLLLAAVGFALVYEALAALRDLRAEPVVTEGEVDRIWKKAKLLVFGRQDYLLVQKRVFEIGAIAATELSVGQVISIEHWPHTMRVITVERVHGDSKS
jgi:hypothetical protein